MKRAAGRLELMDGPVDEPGELEHNLADIEFANRWLGGIAPILREVRRSGARSILDVGSGSGDVPHALVGDGRRRGVEVRATCLDRSDAMLAIARRRTGGDERLTFVRGDGERLPFGDGAFDVVTCSLALHHFEPPAALQLLREMRRVARLTPIVGDLARSRVAFAATWLYARVTTRNRLTRHDAPLSVRRAYEPEEALTLARDAGWRSPRVRREPFFRMTLVDE
ncbi:MAG TPA: methyltransferase domain-containing protein [Candidatus Lustribacter sp.]|nr:methyltransferase domain-containing protein [Candidatus Lustribacter sp.]